MRTCLALLTVGLLLNVALFVSPLERSLLNPFAWFLIVSATYVTSSVLLFNDLRAKRGGSRLVSVVAGIIAITLFCALVFVYVGILALGGLR